MRAFILSGPEIPIFLRGNIRSEKVFENLKRFLNMYSNKGDDIGIVIVIICYKNREVCKAKIETG